MRKSPRYYVDAKSIHSSPDFYSKEEHAIFQDIEKFILQEGYPCVGAQAAINGKTFSIGVFKTMEEREDIKNLALGLENYIDFMEGKASNLQTYLAVFPHIIISDEVEFEKQLWNLAQNLHEIDTSEWAPSVDHDANSPDFSFSFGGKAFFMVGMHPKSSRRARRFKYPIIAFNLQAQFDELRKKGRYEIMKKATRDREIKFDGSINPMLADFGQGSQAAQYSGRKVESNWKCPFLAKQAKKYEYEH